MGEIELEESGGGQSDGSHDDNLDAGLEGDMGSRLKHLREQIYCFSVIMQKKPPGKEIFSDFENQLKTINFTPIKQ
jgi:hypothetical protein